MTQVNLLPSDVQTRQNARRVTLLVAVGAGAAVALLAMVYLVQAARLSKATHDLAVQVSVNQGLQTQIQALHPYEQLKQSVADRQAMVDGLLQAHVEWSGVLRDISMVIPDTVWLTSVSGTVSPAGTGTSAIVGNIQFQGDAFSQPDVAQWLTRLEQVTGWANAWLTQSSSAQVGTTGVVQFTGSVDLTQAATVNGRHK